MHGSPRPAQRDIPLRFVHLTECTDRNAQEDLIDRFSLGGVAGHDQSLIQVPEPLSKGDPVVQANPVLYDCGHGVHVIVSASAVSLKVPHHKILRDSYTIPDT